MLVGGHVLGGLLFWKAARVCKSDKDPVDNIIVSGNMQGPIRVNVLRA
jgi:hypothetical protein